MKKCEINLVKFYNNNKEKKNKEEEMQKLRFPEDFELDRHNKAPCHKRGGTLPFATASLICVPPLAFLRGGIYKLYM